MKGEISVLIADDNFEFGELLREQLIKEQDIDVVGVARDGVQAIESISELKPDVIILDIIMPNLDGIGVLEKISKAQLAYKPIFIMLSAIGHDAFIQNAITLGAEYYLVKPFDIEVLISRIREMFKERKSLYFTNENNNRKKESKSSKSNSYSYTPYFSGPFDLEAEVTHIMRDVGIPAHMSGYQFLREAIIQTINDPRMFTSVTKILYPSVASKYNTTPQKVERSIRNAIESAWTRGNHDSLDSLFGYTINYNKGKPTNSEFIAMMADQVKIMSGKSK